MYLEKIKTSSNDDARRRVTAIHAFAVSQVCRLFVNLPKWNRNSEAGDKIIYRVTSPSERGEPKKTSTVGVRKKLSWYPVQYELVRVSSIPISVGFQF